MSLFFFTFTLLRFHLDFFCTWIEFLQFLKMLTYDLFKYFFFSHPSGGTIAHMPNHSILCYNHRFYVLFFFLFEFGWFYWLVLNFTNPFFCCVRSTIQSTEWILYLWYYNFYHFHLILSYCMHISAEIPLMLNVYLPFFHYIFLTYLGHFFFHFLFLATPHSLWDLRPLTRNWTQTNGSKSPKS